MAAALVGDGEELRTSAGRKKVKTRLRLAAKTFRTHGCEAAAVGFERAIACIEEAETGRRAAMGPIQ